MTDELNRQYIDDVAERDLVARIVQLGNLLTRRLAPAFEKHNITPQQWAVLGAIAAHEPASLAAIAREMLVSKQNMTGMINRLDELGFIGRERDRTDLRSARVTLTRRGRTVLEKLRPVYEEWLASAAPGLSEKELQALARLVDRMIEAVEKG